MVSKLKSVLLSCTILTLPLMWLGCTTNPKYVEGQNLSIGAYVPVSGNLYGAEVLNYLSGVKSQCASNQTMNVDRYYSSTNSYFWGMVNTQDSSHTKVQVGR